MEQVKKKPLGRIIFFCVYAVGVAAILIGLFCLMASLEWHLADYEAAQLDRQCQQVFQTLFADPDWEEIYTLSGQEDTPYEGAEAYEAYMEAKAGGKTLTFREVYSEQSGVHRYLVSLGDEKIAAFTMTGGAASPSEKPQWMLSSVEIVLERSVGVTVAKKPEHTVLINGVALDDSFTVRSTQTRAEAYLPEGIHGYRVDQQYIGDLLVVPEIRVLDENGQPVAVNQDPKTGIYTAVTTPTAEMTDAEAVLARNAAMADARFSMRTLTAAQLQQYFDANSQVYADMVGNPMFVQAHKSSYIDENAVQVSEYCRYSDAHFSARVKLDMKVIRKDGTLKIYPLEKTYFFTRNENGDYLVTDYTNEPVQETVEQVRLTFMAEGKPIACMVDSAVDAVAVPVVPEGKTLVGWAVKTDDGSGNVTMTVRLLPTGQVLGELEPMELYPVYQEN